MNYLVKGKEEINEKSGNSLGNRSRCCGDFFDERIF